MIISINPEPGQWAELLKRPTLETENLFDTVRGIIDRVRAEGDRAVLAYEAQFDKVCLTTLAVTEEEMQQAEAGLDETLKPIRRLVPRREHGIQNDMGGALQQARHHQRVWRRGTGRLARRQGDPFQRRVPGEPVYREPEDAGED